jgi:hypothetical protein
MGSQHGTLEGEQQDIKSQEVLRGIIDRLGDLLEPSQAVGMHMFRSCH